MRLEGAVASMGKNRTVVHKPEGWRLLGRPKHRWECNIKTGLNLHNTCILDTGRHLKSPGA
jgi:hypothetical protein